MLLDPFREIDFQKFPPIGLFLERETVARELLGDRACALPDMTGDKIFEGGPDNSRKIVSAVLIEFVVFHSDHGIHEIAR